MDLLCGLGLNAEGVVRPASAEVVERREGVFLGVWRAEAGEVGSLPVESHRSEIISSILLSPSVKELIESKSESNAVPLPPSLWLPRSPPV